MKKNKIAVIPGDGVGPDVIDATIKVLREVSPDLEYKYFEAGYTRYQKKGEAITDEILAELQEHGAILFGAVASPPGDVKNYRSSILTMRQGFDLFANIRPVKSYIKDNGLDVVIVH